MIQLMVYNQTDIKDVYSIDLDAHQDPRGYFMRIFCQDDFKKNGIDFTIRQISKSLNAKKNTLRGIHFHKQPIREQKIIRCIRGAIYDVVVDLRKKSPTYGKWMAQYLDEGDRKMFYIPDGCGHGFQTLVDNTEVEYFMSEFYNPEYYSGIRWDDPDLNIQWPEANNRIISDNDKNWPMLKN